MARRKAKPAKKVGKFTDIMSATSPFEHATAALTPHRITPIEPLIPNFKPKVINKRKPIQSRRHFEGYALQDPQEARAVPESVFPGTILERIMYKRNLILFGNPGHRTWTAQSNALEYPAAHNYITGIRLDFVYWMSYPPTVIEPQGLFWHGPFARWGDNNRGFIIKSLGFKYLELWEDAVLSMDDTWLDNQILTAIGTPQPFYYEYNLTLPPEFPSMIQYLQSFAFKESARFL